MAFAMCLPFTVVSTISYLESCSGARGCPTPAFPHSSRRCRCRVGAVGARTFPPCCAHPQTPPIAPSFQICVIGSIVPLLMYITFFDDFKHLNPLLPQHYARIMARAFRALAKNDLKVTEKNL